MRLGTLALFLLLLLPLSAQLSQSLVDADTLTVGARFQLILKADTALISVTIPDSLDGFAVLGKDLITKRTSNPYFRITLSPLKTGALSFPPLKVTAGDGEHLSNGFRINVLAVRAEQDSTLRDIKPLRRYPLQRPLWLYLLLPLAILAYLIWILSRRKKPTDTQTEVPPAKTKERVLSPWESALRDLERLEAEELLQQGDYPAFHFGLSMILRRFLEEQYHFGAQEMTTLEIRAALQRLGLDSSSGITRFLLFCDQVKFARAIPSPDEINSSLHWLKTYLESFGTQPRETEHVPLG